MSRYTAAADRLGDGIIDTFCDDDAPDVVFDIMSALADAMRDNPEVDRLELAIEVVP